MNRRMLLAFLGSLPLLSRASSALSAGDVLPPVRARVRPGDRGWPTGSDWARLNKKVEGRLVMPRSPLVECAPESCHRALESLKNPFYVGDEVGLTQTSGWVGAWTSQQSAYAVAAANTQDVIEAVNFAREHHLRLVIKGGGHSYQGTSQAPDSLLIWTRSMNAVVLHDAFVPQGCGGKLRPEPAVSIEAGAMWIDAYQAVTTQAGRYVQGGGCTTVGVAGLVQSGGFGSFSKNFGCAAAGLLEAEVVTADGVARIVNECQHADLFYALKGGGGGSFGVVTRLVLRTRPLPKTFGGVFGAIAASSSARRSPFTAIACSVRTGGSSSCSAGITCSRLRWCSRVSSRSRRRPSGRRSSMRYEPTGAIATRARSRSERCLRGIIGTRNS